MKNQREISENAVENVQGDAALDNLRPLVLKKREVPTSWAECEEK
jgi:hypothetical protein